MIAVAKMTNGATVVSTNVIVQETDLVTCIQARAFAWMATTD